MSLDPGTIRRLVTFVVGLVVIALNKKLGFDLSEADSIAIATIIAAYLGQSAYKEAQEKKAEAAVATAAAESKKVDNLDKAIEVLKAPPKP